MGTGLEEKGSGGWESGDSFSGEEKQIHANAVGLVNAQREAGTQLAAWSVFLYWATTLVKGTYHALTAWVCLLPQTGRQRATQPQKEMLRSLR